MKLLSRENFNKLVLERDNHKCVICGSTNELDVHHITERKIFTDGGYYLDNGITLCGGQSKDSCHYKAEIGEFTPYFLREKVDIKTLIYPQCMDIHTYPYDKWGTILCGVCSGKKSDYHINNKGEYLVKYNNQWLGFCEECLLNYLIECEKLNKQIIYKKISVE